MDLNLTNQIKKITETFTSKPGPGARCMSNHKIVISNLIDKYRSSKTSNILNCYADTMVNAQQKSLMPITSNYSVFLNLTRTKPFPTCSCKTGFPDCQLDNTIDMENRETIKLRTTDILVNLTELNVSDWLMKTEFNKKYFRKRFGGFEFLDPLVVNETLVERALNMLKATLNITVNNPDRFVANKRLKIWYNNKGFYAHVSYLNMMNNAFLRSQITDNKSDYGIVNVNHPMGFHVNDVPRLIMQQAKVDLFVAVCIIFALSFIPASFLVFLLEERKSHAKQLQFVSGVKPYVYWISNYMWDLLNYGVPCLICVFVFFLFNATAYIAKENLPCLIMLMLLYGWACIPLMYPLNYVFQVPSTVFVIASCLNLFIGKLGSFFVNIFYLYEASLNCGNSGKIQIIFPFAE
jgi:hypothetical protein